MSTMQLLPFFTPLYDLVQTRTGLRLSDTQQQDLARLIEKPDGLLTPPNPNEWAVLLREQPTESALWQSVIRCATVGETYFFRNQAQFDALRTVVLPALIENQYQRGQKQLRLWSAGCATGEEPFSLAIVLRDLLPDIDSWQVTILATDINSDNLERARHGLYRAWSFRNETPADVRDRWFSPEGDNFTISPAIRRMVDFRLLNLINDDYPSLETGIMDMDVILCRNVTIYFDQKTTQGIAERFHRVLNADGWLVVGHAEPISSVYQGFEPRNFPDTVLYQKVPLTKSTLEIRPVEPVPVFRPAIQVNTNPAYQSKESPAPEPETKKKERTQAGDAWEKARQAADAEKWDNALVWLMHAEAAYKFQPHVYHLRATVQWQLGDLEGAMVSLRQAIYCDPNFALAHYTLAALSEARGDHKLASRHWRLAQRAIRDMALSSSCLCRRSHRRDAARLVDAPVEHPGRQQ